MHKLLTEQFKKEFLKKIKTWKESNKEFLETKGTSEKNGTFEVVATSSKKDRHGEILTSSGWELENFKKNPVILFAHNSWDFPIGRATDIKFEEDKMIVKGEFAPGDANPKAQQVRKLYDAGFIKAVSVGLIPLEREGNVVTRKELVELSFVPIPANPEALSKMQKAGIKTLDFSLLKCDEEEEEKEEEEKKTEETETEEEAEGENEDEGEDKDKDKEEEEEGEEEGKEKKSVDLEILKELKKINKRIDKLEDKATKEAKKQDVKVHAWKKAFQSVDKIAEAVLKQFKAERRDGEKHDGEEDNEGEE